MLLYVLTFREHWLGADAHCGRQPHYVSAGELRLQDWEIFVRYQEHGELQERSEGVAVNQADDVGAVWREESGACCLLKPQFAQAEVTFSQQACSRPEELQPQEPLEVFEQEKWQQDFQVLEKRRKAVHSPAAPEEG